MSVNWHVNEHNERCLNTHMRLTLTQYMKQRLRRPSAYHAIGIAYTADQVLLCALKYKAGVYSWALDASFSHQSWQTKLKDYVQKHKLGGTPCFFALSSHWYRIHQVDKPQVADDELFDALQWPVKEALGTDKDIVYDFAELPVQVAGQNKVLAVAVASEEIKKLSNIIYAADLRLNSIVVEELAMTHLVESSSEPVITLVQEHGEVVVLNIIKDNQIYFTRRIKGFENIGEFSEAELQMGISESICVQIQRSMDFFESQLRQAPIKRILLKLDSPHIDYLSSLIADAMGVECASLEPDIECAEGLTFKMASFSCLGAAITGAKTMLDKPKANKKSSRKKQAKNDDNVNEMNEQEVADEIAN